MQPRFEPGDECEFTNRGPSAWSMRRGRIGTRCKILRIKDRSLWENPQRPEYVIKMLRNNFEFGCRESELEMVRPGVHA
ncbi:MAG: hypothetical protein AAB421_05360 [Patescibacteria group bacterium]